jgi:acetyl esterase/lipase
MTHSRRLFLGLPAMLAAQNILERPPPKDGEHIAYGSDQFQFGELRVPAGAGPHPVVIVIHGGYWRAAYDLKHIGHLCAAITAAGFATWSMEYRRLGNAGGGWPGTFDDIRSGAAHLNKIANEKKLDLGRVVATGHSAGGHLVLWLAKQKAVPLRGVVPLAPVADLRRAYELRLSGTVVGQLLGGSPEQYPDRYRAASPPEMLPLGVKQRVIHGIDDNIVPLSISRGYVDAARAKGDDATLNELRGAGHFEVIDPRSAAWPAVRDAIKGLAG